MSARHRVEQAMKLGLDLENFEHRVYEDGKTAHYVFSDPRTARVVADILRAIFKSARPQIIHNGRKPK